MDEKLAEALSVTVEREMPFPPEKVWRALTQPHLIEEWLMKNDFKPVVGHCFNLRADWGVVDCQVLLVEPDKTLSYTWAAYDLRECRHLDSHPYEQGDAIAHGAVGLPAGSAAILPGREGRVAEVLCSSGAGLGADRLKNIDGLGGLRKIPSGGERWGVR